MLKSIFSLLLVATFTCAHVARHDRRGIMNMLNDKHAKDQYQPAKSDLYSDSMATTTFASPVETPARGKMHIGDKVVEVEEWTVSESPEYIQANRVASNKRVHSKHASDIFNLRYSMRHKLHDSNWTQKHSSWKAYGHSGIYASSSDSQLLATPTSFSS
ncbi:hypothetical protein RMATCC62417_05668 [Rhizopus microsporus]|nr:hypothetical protein RMATCC62417_05668 [Rhizopus microsporus]